MSKTNDNAVTGILADAAELARKLAEQEPFKSATGPVPNSSVTSRHF